MRYDLDFGSANAGQVPAFSLFENADTNVAIVAPAIVERSAGIFYFDWDWTTTTATSIRWKATCNGVELSDVITSDAVTTASGTGSAGAGTLAWLWTAGQVVNTAAVECGLSEVVDPYASTDANFKQLCSLLKTAGHELVLARDWPTLVKECTITGDGAATVFALPSDFLRMADDSAWDRSTQWPMVLASSQQWQALKARSVTGQVRVRYRIAQGRIQFHEAPPLSEDLRFDYFSRFWAMSSGAVSADLYQPASSGDTVMFEPLLAVRALIYKFKVAKGLDASGALADYEAAMEGAAGLAPATALSLNGSSQGERFLDGFNLPETGWGS